MTRLASGSVIVSATASASAASVRQRSASSVSAGIVSRPSQGPERQRSTAYRVPTPYRIRANGCSGASPKSASVTTLSVSSRVEPEAPAHGRAEPPQLCVRLIPEGRGPANREMSGPVPNKQDQVRDGPASRPISHTCSIPAIGHLVGPRKSRPDVSSFFGGHCVSRMPDGRRVLRYRGVVVRGQGRGLAGVAPYFYWPHRMSSLHVVAPITVAAHRKKSTGSRSSGQDDPKEGGRSSFSS